MFGAAGFLIAHLAFVPPEIRGAGTCPSVDEVSARLAPLFPTAPLTKESGADVVVLETSGGQVAVRLRDPSGVITHERILEASASCAERATEVAVLIATWEADLHAEVAFPGAEPQAPRLAPPLPAPVDTVDTARVAPRPEAAAPPPEVTLGAELFVAAPPDAGKAPAGSIEATWGRGDPWHGRTAISATGTHTLALPPGQVSWRRATLALGVMGDLTRGRVRLSARLDALAAVILSQGTGFNVDAAATSWQAGADVGLRLSVPVTHRFTVWVDVAAAAFPGSQRLSALNVTGAPELPSLEIDGGLGGSFSLFP
jgi:hypothetical protein